MYSIFTRKETQLISSSSSYPNSQSETRTLAFGETWREFSS